jgi:DNA-binding MarR family transcriptional regulator
MEDIVPGRWQDETRVDAVAQIARRWRVIDPALDSSPMLVIGRIGRLAAYVDARLRPPFAAAGLATGDFDLLAALRRQDPPHELSPGELADAMLVTTGATTKRIDRLEAQALVGRRSSTTDKRGRIVALTEAGRVLVDELMPEHLDNEASILAALTPAQRADLAQLLSILLASLEPD